MEDLSKAGIFDDPLELSYEDLIELTRHSSHVGKIAYDLATYIKIDRKSKLEIYQAALRHDIAKALKGFGFWKKKGYLYGKDDHIAKISHPIVGAMWALYNIPNPSDNLIAGILHHHERIDSKGYPSGLRGEIIPLIARIIAIADTYDAMTTRSYSADRPAKTPEEALKILKEVAGTQLDAYLVDKFIEMTEIMPASR